MYGSLIVASDTVPRVSKGIKSNHTYISTEILNKSLTNQLPYHGSYQMPRRELYMDI